MLVIPSLQNSRIGDVGQMHTRLFEDRDLVKGRCD